MRAVLYMSALVATRRNPVIRAFYLRLVVTAKAFLIDGPVRKSLHLEIEAGTADGAVNGVLTLLKENGHENVEPVPCP